MAAIPRVIILGGGLAGLAAAIRLAETGYEVEVLELVLTLKERLQTIFDLIEV